MENRGSWTGRIGFIFAAAGSAVGVGNIWRFSYATGQNGGAAFILVYILCALFIGISVMVAEFIVGRRENASAVGAFKGVNRSWTFVGMMGVLAAFFIMGFYPIVGGWSVSYIFKAITGSAFEDGTFGSFIMGGEPLLWVVIFMIINIFIVSKGVEKGIEKAAKFLMPALLGLLIILAIRGLTLEGSGEGVSFIFKPDFSKVTGGTFLASMGQAFFSLSLGMGCMITYGSYLRKEEKIPRCALTVTLLDTGIALLAGLAIFPALFALGGEPTAGPGLVFVVVPATFASLGTVGVLFSVLFFIALSVAALTSSISLLEVPVAYMVDEKKIDRKKATLIASAIMVAACIPASLLLGQEIPLFGLDLFDLFDKISGDFLLGVGGLLTCVFIGWVVKKEDVKRELNIGADKSPALFSFWYLSVRIIIPLIIGYIVIRGFIDVDYKMALVGGAAIVAVTAVISKKID